MKYKDNRCKEHEWDDSIGAPPVVTMQAGDINLHCRKCGIWRVVWKDQP